MKLQLKNREGTVIETASCPNRTSAWRKVILDWAQKHKDYELRDQDGNLDMSASDTPPGGSGQLYTVVTDYENEQGLRTEGGFWGQVLGATGF